jgi:D-3-phosphoglycerate dehydrogenase / 2-oxoglutarate reductase
MRVLVCDKTETSAIQQMRQAGISVDEEFEISPVELIDAIGQYDGVIVRSRTKITSQVIEAAKKLKIIVRGGVGLDTIDTAYARQNGIAVFNTPRASSTAVAELTIGYILALARSIPQAYLTMKNGIWEKKKFIGEEIQGKVLGIVGIGNIGMEVAWRARALGMVVEAYDPYVSNYDHVMCNSLEELLTHADYLSFHLPLTDETKLLIGKEQFEIMKPGVKIINCARGGIINEDDLYEAIASGRVAGAAIDVFEKEPVENHPLFHLPNVIGSPHIGASTIEAQSKIGAEVAQIIINFFSN